jgi:anti-sigma factor RsiW
MTCQEAQVLIGAYLDGELDLVTSLQIENHLKDCSGCQTQRTRSERLSRAIHQPGLYAKAPVGLDLKIRRQNPAPAIAPVWRWLTIAAAVTAIAVCSAILLNQFSRPSRNEFLAREVESSHVRSLMANHLTDVLSTDQHTVKPWFNGKLDFTPMVKDLGDRGFSLIGGRLDYLDDHAVAALLYKRNQHPINLFEWPSSVVSEPQTTTIRGYNLIHWSKSGMTFWAVSDLNAGELSEFVRDIRAN